MSSLVPIAKVRRQRVQKEVRASLTAGLDVGMLSNFLASVDWSGVSTKRPKIADDLGNLEAWLTQYTESFISQDQFIARLLSVLPKREQDWKLFFGDEPTVFKVVNWVAHPSHLVVYRSAQPAGELRTGSGTPDQTVPVARSTDIVRVA